MPGDVVVQVGTEAMRTILMVSAPLLCIAMTVGLLVSVFQAVTQIQEMTLTFVPKILALLGGLYIFSNYMVERLVAFTQRMIELIPQVIW